MKTSRFMRFFMLAGAGAMMFQGAACTTDPLTTFNDFAQTILLGITAAGSIAILQNI